MCHLWGSIYEAKLIVYRSSHLEDFCKKGVPRKFTKFTRKHLYRSVLFNKVASLHLVASFKKELRQSFFKNTFFKEHLRVTAPKYNVTFKELFSFIHRNLKWKPRLNTLFTINLSFYVKVVFYCFLKRNIFFESLGQIKTL